MKYKYGWVHLKERGIRAVEFAYVWEELTLSTVTRGHDDDITALAKGHSIICLFVGCRG